MEFSEISYIVLATVGMTEVIKNLVQKGGKRTWTIVTLIVGAIMVLVDTFCPEKILIGVIAVSGATIFYDTVFKAFQKAFERIGGNQYAD